MAEELRQGEWGPTPLDEPPEEGNPDFPEWSEVVGAIKRDDANSVRIVPEPPNEMGLLHYAVLASALTCAEKLLDSNADVDARSSETVSDLSGSAPLAHGSCAAYSIRAACRSRTAGLRCMRQHTKLGMPRAACCWPEAPTPTLGPSKTTPHSTTP